MIVETAKELKANNPADIVKKASVVMQDLKNAGKEIDQLNAKIASSMAGSIKDSAKEVGGVTLYTGKLSGTTVDTARNMTDDIKAENDLSVTVIAVVSEGKVNFAASCGKEAVKKGAHAGNLLKKLSAICGGGGGGRPDSAMSGGKLPEKADEALAAAETVLLEMLK